MGLKDVLQRLQVGGYVMVASNLHQQQQLSLS